MAQTPLRDTLHSTVRYVQWEGEGEEGEKRGEGMEEGWTEWRSKKGKEGGGGGGRRSEREGMCNVR